MWVLVLMSNRDEALLESLVAEVEKNVNGHRITVEGEDDKPEEVKPVESS